MIVVDTSALPAIMFQEHDKATFEAVILSDDESAMSAISALEATTVLRARVGTQFVVDFWSFIARASIEVAPLDLEQVHAAAEAFDRFGKGIHPQARLNICDCAAYALAKRRDAPLLFKGDDFRIRTFSPRYRLSQ